MREKLNIDPLESDEIYNQKLANIKLKSNAHNSKMQKQQDRINAFSKASVKRNTNSTPEPSQEPSKLDNIDNINKNSVDDS